jgi:lipopolysaccharide cholinephosphotransferase
MKEDFSKYNGEGTALRKAQLRMLNILVEIDKICRKHNITYFIEGGTLLGAVRHKGFIPWDDDIDILVFKRDYKKLRKVLIEELPKQYFFSDWTTDKYHYDNYGRVKDTKSVFPFPLFRKQKAQGAFVDVFTCSPIYSARMRKFVNFFYRRMFRELHHFGYVKYESKIRRFQNILIAAISVPFVYALVLLHKILASVRHKRLMSYDFITNTFVYSEKILLPPKELEFEGKMFKCMANYDSYLKILYGDYMQLPPENKRLPHVTEIIVYD